LDNGKVSTLLLGKQVEPPQQHRYEAVLTQQKFKFDKL
jgi:hypothetical protein